MNKKPTVSVIIPTYNRAHLVGRAIQSVLDQTYKDFELIVVDDGSNDNTEYIIKEFQKKDERIKYVAYKKNKGGSAARNAGIKSSKGEYIAFLDSDDEWLSEKLEKQIRLFKIKPKKVGVLYCGYYNFDDNTGLGKLINCSFEKDVRIELFKGWCPPTPLLMVRKECFNVIGFFDEQLFSFQEYDLCVRLSEVYDFAYVDKPLVRVHKHLGHRISINILTRQRGIEIFLQKWEEEIKSCLGIKGWRNIKKHYYRILYWNAAIHELNNSHSKKGLAYLFKSIKYSPLNYKLYVRIMITVLGGSRFHNFIERLYKKYLFKKERKIMKGIGK